jgi:hypothetical protein
MTFVLVEELGLMIIPKHAGVLINKLLYQLQLMNKTKYQIFDNKNNKWSDISNEQFLEISNKK